MAQERPQTFLQTLADLYSENFIIKADPMVLKWTLANDDRLNFAIVICYLAFVLKLGPLLMKNRKPLNLRWLMIPYNIALVFFNFYIFFEIMMIRWSGDADVSCKTLDISSDPYTYRLTEISYWFYISKFIELMDTVFFVLRKKENQLSKLHLIHHSSVPILCLGMLRSEPGGNNAFFPLANSFVHCIMYTYYACSALGDEYTFHLKVKRYVTMVQLIQFILVLMYFFSRPLFGCQTSNMSFRMNVALAGFFFTLFCNFYWNEYVKRAKEKEEAKRLACHSNGKKSRTD